MTVPPHPAPFEDFPGRPRRTPDPLRAAITEACRVPEPVCVPPLLAAATTTPAQAEAIAALATRVVTAMRRRKRSGGIEALMHEYALSSQEGIALMCLAEALLRIPDNATRDALIADKIAPGDWQSHLGHARSLFVNATTWGLVITGKLVAPVDEEGLSKALTRLVARSGEPVIRASVNLAMKMIGEQFVAGQTIAEALSNARAQEARGFRYSYDMLGEAAATRADAERYYDDYAAAIHAIGKAAGGRGIYEGPGISIKLSALHPRYQRAQHGRVMGELLPRLKALAALARSYDIGLNIDAEEADRLEISLDLLEALCADPELSGWDGLGFVVQAYSKRCPAVIDHLVDLARRAGRRLMVRLVKGAYWDSEIKRAQIEGLDDFPVFTRKVHTDLCYIACAKKLLAAPDAAYPQFATHNAQTMSTIHVLAGPDYKAGQYEFQCLHGMGEPLYGEVVGPDKLDRPCRIYAPVGSHETLLAYLVRRLLENGANSSFVNQIADHAIPIPTLVEDPVAVAGRIRPVGAPHPAIALPCAILGPARALARGLDLASDGVLARLADDFAASAAQAPTAAPADAETALPEMPVLNPANHADRVGTVRHASEETVAAAMARAGDAAAQWALTPVAARADILARAASMMEDRMPDLMALAMREAGKTAANAVAEVREAVDFLRYYAREALAGLPDGGPAPLGPVVCISPWNFPLAIFTGQVAAALASGNGVLAKPAEETPLIAMAAVEILHTAGVPADALEMLPGDGAVGAALVAHPATRGVIFTGSTEVARKINQSLAGRLLEDGRPLPLIAETGGQNAMVVDSSALTEQVVADVLASAFDSAGQRCSALRVLCLQDEIAGRTLAMLKGAMAELAIGRPDRLATDIGPVITEEARRTITTHIEAMRASGQTVFAANLPKETERGTFVAPTLVEIDAIGRLEREVFGPVLHVLRYERADLPALLDAINGLGYGLTFGLHTRIDTAIRTVTDRVAAGNVYVNRNQIGAVVGVQPFGGHGLSGTGPKAGGPLYLSRLVQRHAPGAPVAGHLPDPAVAAWARHAAARGHDDLSDAVQAYGATAIGSVTAELPGPVGERNVYGTRPRGTVLVTASTPAGLVPAVAAALSAGNHVVVEAGDTALLAGLPADLEARIDLAHGAVAPEAVEAVVIAADADAIAAMTQRVAAWPGPIVPVLALTPEALAAGAAFGLETLVHEWTVTTNTAAAGGNATLMAVA